MIIISMTTADPKGNLVLTEGNSKFGNLPSRASRQATLDGGCVITHSGVADGDRTFYVETKGSAEQKGTLEYIHRNSTQVLISCKAGLFLGAISTINTDDGIKATIIIKSKEA